MNLHYDKYGDSLFVTEGQGDIFIVTCNHFGRRKEVRIFSPAEAWAIAEEILKCCEGVKDDADAN